MKGVAVHGNTDIVMMTALLSLYKPSYESKKHFNNGDNIVALQMKRSFWTTAP